MKAIDELPDDVPSLYDMILLNCNKKRTAPESAALKLIFAWMSFSERPLTLEEVYGLQNLKFGKIVVDLEEEIAGKCAKYVPSDWDT